VAFWTDLRRTSFAQGWRRRTAGKAALQETAREGEADERGQGEPSDDELTRGGAPGK